MITRAFRPRLPALLAAALAIGSLARAQVTFVDVASDTGTDQLSYGRGVAWADLDGDGLLDLVCANAGMNNAVYRQRSDRTFEDVYAAWGFADDARAHWGVLAADFDNDGDVDLYVLNGGFTGAQSNQLLRNDLAGSGVFTDVSGSSGDADLIKSTFGGTTLDYDRDGRLDLFLSNLANQGCTLLRNLGGMVFQDVSAAAGIAESGGNYRHCTAGDIDNDGWLDVGVGNYWGDNAVYRNLGNGTFAEVASACGLAAPDKNFGLVFEDFDNDGWMDAYVPKYQVRPTGTSLLFLNNRDGTFRDVSAGSGIGGQADMGHDVADVDADGFPDVFIGTGNPSKKMDDYLLHVTPDGAGGLLVNDVSDSSGIRANGPTRCHGSSFADYDNDGDVDLFANNGGPEADPAMLETSFLWQNQGGERAWLEAGLRGVISNRSAVGARAVVRGASGREVHRFLSAGKGFGNTDSAVLHFGLDTESDLEELLVTWPSGIPQRLLRPEARTRVDLIETGLILSGTPAPGATLTLDACGPAGDRVHVFVAAATTWLEVPGIGVLEVLPPLIEILVQDLDGSGRTAFAIDVPDDPSLSGELFHLQGWIVASDFSSPGTLTNHFDVRIQ